MDVTEQFVDDVAAEGVVLATDIGSIIVLACLEADGNHDAMLAALESARQKLKNLPGMNELSECLSGADAQIRLWAEGQL